ncbi:nuclear RNA export factor 1-like, partial [Aphis craccivora]
QILLEAYHENATFTLSSSLPFKNANGSISEYLPESRNFLKINRQKYKKRRYLHKGKDNITNFLDKLPKTKHDHGSFVDDVPLANDAMVQIVLNGVFAENFKETNDRHEFRSFCRTFCIVPESSKRFQIYKQKPMYNEVPLYQGGMPKSILQVQQMAPAATTVTQHPQQQPTVESPSTSSYMEVNELSTGAPIDVINDDDSYYIKMSMVQRFSNESGMNNKWAEKCLEKNEWDYSKACTCFYYMKDKIPFEAFIYECLL